VITPLFPVTMTPALSYQVSVKVSREIGASPTFFTCNLVTTFGPSRLVTAVVYSTMTSPRAGGTIFLPARIGCIGGACGVCWAASPAAAAVVTRIATRSKRAHFMVFLPEI
jgi:hypothetical protein